VFFSCACFKSLPKKTLMYQGNHVTPANAYMDAGDRATQDAKAGAGAQGFHQKYLNRHSGPTQRTARNDENIHRHPSHLRWLPQCARQSLAPKAGAMISPVTH